MSVVALVRLKQSANKAAQKLEQVAYKARAIS